MDDAFLAAYRGKGVLVTGHTGFKGAWLSLWLSRLGARVAGFALDPPTDPNIFTAAGVEGQLARHQIGDVRDFETLRAFVQRTRPDVVFHLAAQPLVRESYREPRATYETNVMGTVHLLDAIRGTSTVRACVVVTSDKCYENREQHQGYRERDPMGGWDPYSSSKGCAELVTAAYRRSFFTSQGRGAADGVAVASARGGNIVGGGDWGDDRLVPDCIRALAAGRAIVLRNPGATRPWQYVLDALAGYLKLGAALLTEGPAFAEGWNFGPPPATSVTVGELVQEVVARWGNGKVEIDAAPQLHEAGLLAVDPTKARERLGWRTLLSVPEMIEKAVSWYRAYYDCGTRAEDLFDRSTAEIAEYEARLARG